MITDVKRERVAMTRKEAIWWANHLFEIRKEEYFNRRMMKDAKEVQEAQTMVLEALSSEPPKGELILRADAIDAVVCHIWHMPNEAYRQFNCENIVREVVEDAIKRLPSADITETDGVITIEKQSAKDVGEIKHIVVCSPNYTRYFYNDSMPTQYKGGEEE